VIALPAIDLREGACVQLVGGEYDAERVRLRNPLAVALRWRAAGFRALHVVDLDAATGCGSNAGIIESLLRAGDGCELQIGGGLRDDAAVARLLALGAARVVVGTRGIEDPGWLERLAASHPGRIVLAADVRGRRLLTRGWASSSTLDLLTLLERVAPLPLAGVLVTAVHLEGQQNGVDAPLMREVVDRCAQPVIASGGVSSPEDLRSLAALGCAAAVIGMALYTRRLDAAATAREFG
jgi:phosphoribosylformimino-5-aminoimidazole carboxamide ribotide isomerase